MKVFGVRVIEGLGTPGEVQGIVPQGLAVACGGGAVAFAELQLPGRKRLLPPRYSAGHPIPVGTRLRNAPRSSETPAPAATTPSE